MAGVPRLAPLDHVRNLYREAEALLPGDRPITRKQDLIRAVRAATSTADQAKTKKPPLHGSASTPTLPGATSSTTSGDGDRALGKSSSVHALDVDNAAETAEKATRELETQVNVSAKKYNDMKRHITLKKKRLNDLQAELSALVAENMTLTVVESRTHMLALSGGATKRPVDGEGTTAIDAKTGEAWSNPWESSDDDNDDEEGAPASGSPLRHVGTLLGTAVSLPPGVLQHSLNAQSGSAPDILAATATGSKLLLNSTSTGALLSVDGPSAALQAATTAALKLRNGRRDDVGISLSPVEAAEIERIRALRKQIKSVRRNMTRREFTKRQYEHMAARLRVNAAAFERHMKGLDDAIRAARKELSDVNGYIRLLEASRDGAVVELHKLQQQLALEKTNRARELEERKAELSKVQKMDEWRQHRAQVRAEMRAQLAGDLNKEQEAQLVRSLASKEAHLQQLLLDKLRREERATVLQDAFVRVKGVTGVATLEDMVERILGVPGLHAALVKEKADTMERSEDIRQQLESATRELQTLKASGGLSSVPAEVGSASESWKEDMQRLQRLLTSAKQQLRLHRSGEQRLADVLLAARQGAFGLATMLQPFKDIIGVAGDAMMESKVAEEPSIADSMASDSPSSRASLQQLAEVRKQGSDTLKYLTRVESSMSKALTMLAKAVKDKLRAALEEQEKMDNAEAAAASDTFLTSVNVAQDGKAEELSDAALVRALEKLLGPADAKKQNDLSPQELHILDKLERCIHSRADVLLSLSPATVRLISSTVTGVPIPEELLSPPRLQSRGGGRFRAGFVGSQSLLATLDAPPTLPSPDVDFSLSAVTVPRVDPVSRQGLRTPMIVDPPMYVNNIRVEPQARLDPKSGKLVGDKDDIQSPPEGENKPVSRGIVLADPASINALSMLHEHSDEEKSEDGEVGDEPDEQRFQTALRMGVGSRREEIRAVLHSVSGSRPVTTIGRRNPTSPIPLTHADKESVISGRASIASPAGGAKSTKTKSVAPSAFPTLTMGTLLSLPALHNNANEDDGILDRSAVKKRAAESRVQTEAAVTPTAGGARRSSITATTPGVTELSLLTRRPKLA